METLKFNVFNFLNKPKKTIVPLVLLCPTFPYFTFVKVFRLSPTNFMTRVTRSKPIKSLNFIFLQQFINRANYGKVSLRLENVPGNIISVHRSRKRTYNAKRRKRIGVCSLLVAHLRPVLFKRCSVEP